MMKRPRKDMRIAFSDSQRDDLNECTRDVNATMQSPNQRNSITGASFDGASNKAERKADTGSIDSHKMKSTSPHSSIESNRSQNDDECLGKHQYLTRRHGRNNVSYDMKHHPMDDVLRPKYSAKRRAQGKQIPKELSDSDIEIPQDGASNASSEQTNSLVSHRRRSSRHIHRTKTPIYSAKWHPLDKMLGEFACATSESKRGGHGKSNRTKSDGRSAGKEDFKTVNSDFGIGRFPDTVIQLCGTSPISPNLRRSARVSSSKDALPNYDMKFHIMDSILRPKTAAKRLQFKLHSTTPNQTLRKSVPSAETDTPQSANASPESATTNSIHSESELDFPVAPAWSQLQNPYLDRTSIDWAEIQEMDRCTYLLQRGAPFHGNTSPQDWTYDFVKKVLSDEGMMTCDELSSLEGTELLKARYESVRLGLQNFFDSGPEPIDKKDWILSKIEGFDVYDWKRGSMYWKHQMDSIVEGTKTASNPNVDGFVAQTAKRPIKNHKNLATVSASEDKSRSEAESSTKTQLYKNEEMNPNRFCPKVRPAPEVDIKQTIVVDLMDDADLNRISETEENLVESMRGGQASSSMMSDAALEELLFPAEQFLEDGSFQNGTNSLVSRKSSAEHPRLATTHPDKTFEELSSLASEAKTLDLNTSSYREPAERIPLGKDETTSDVVFGARDRSGMPQTPTAETRARKRKSRIDVAIAVHEDLPGRTPILKKIVAMNPSSPGTDIPKENLEDDRLVELSSQVEVGTPQHRQHYEAIGTPSTRRFRHVRRARTATQPSRSLFGRPLGSLSPGSSPARESN